MKQVSKIFFISYISCLLGYRSQSSELEGRGSYKVDFYTLLLQQFWGIIVKRFYYVRRNWRGLFSQILLPALFVCIAMSVALTAPQVVDLPKIIISPAQYHNYSKPDGNHMTYADHTEGLSWPEWCRDASMKEILRTLRFPAGLAASCVLRNPDSSNFVDSILRQINTSRPNYRELLKYYESGCGDVIAKNLAPQDFLPPAIDLTPAVPGNDSDFVRLGEYCNCWGKYSCSRILRPLISPEKYGLKSCKLKVV